MVFSEDNPLISWKTQDCQFKMLLVPRIKDSNIANEVMTKFFIVEEN